MPGLENLFAAEPKLPSVQTLKMPENPQEWAEAITVAARERYPDLAHLPLVIEFRKKDEQAGTAVGAIHVTSDDDKKTIFLPIVIKKFELSPLDVWMEKDTQAIHPIKPDTFKKAFFNPSSAKGLDVRPTDVAGQYFNDPSTWSSNYPPLQGRYSYASAGYPILDSISDTIREKELKEFRETLQKNAFVLAKFKRGPHYEVIQKLAAKIPTKDPDYVASATKLIPVGAASIKREGKDKYSVLSMADQMFDLAASEYLDEYNCRNWLSKITAFCKDSIHDLPQQGEKLLVTKPAPKGTVYLFDQTKYSPVSADEFAAYVVKTKTGVQSHGVVFPNVVEFNGDKAPVKLFVSQSHCSFQTNIAGEKKPDSEMMAKVLKPSAARVGQTGTFVFIDDGQAIATVPVTIKAIEEYGQARITAIKLDGTKIKISRGYSDDPPKMTEALPCTKPAKTKDKFLDVHSMIEDRPKEYTIPRSMIWIPMEGFQEVSSSPKEWMQKEAAKVSHDPFNIRYTGIVYEAYGSDIEKRAFSERELKVTLANKGADAEMIDSVIKVARAKGKCCVHGLRQLKKKADIIKVATDASARLEKACAELKRDLVKFAAEVGDSSMTVDAMLSLNFVNPENLAKFVSYKPVFEKVADYLAELLMAARLGIKDMSESALVTAIARIQEVIDGLAKVQTSLSGSGEKV
jgi:hypothetical protein